MAGIAGEREGFQNPYPWIAGAALVLCSDHEGMPNVLVEALACGTPVVATDCPSGPRELLGRDAPDWLVPTGDAAALADAIGRGLASPGDAARVDLSRFAPGKPWPHEYEHGLAGNLITRAQHSRSRVLHCRGRHMRVESVPFRCRCPTATPSFLALIGYAPCLWCPRLLHLDGGCDLQVGYSPHGVVSLTDISENDDAAAGAPWTCR
jgi:hypothetical protein